MTSGEKNGSNGKRDTVRQTIVETIEAPRLKDVETADFVTFKEKREIYERLIQEKNAESGVQIPLTTLRNSIEKSVLELFIVANWVTAADVRRITEDHLRKCIEERAKVDPADYDLARIEREIQSVKLGKGDRNCSLERQVWRLFLKYSNKLRECGYENFVKEQPKLAVKHIMKRVTHVDLHTRMVLTLKLHKEELRKDFAKFMRLLAEEARIFDRHDSARAYKAEQEDSDDLEITPVSDNVKIRRGRGGRNRNRTARTTSVPGFAAAPVAERNDKAGGRGTHTGNNKRSRELPNCLLPRCNKLHYIKDCDLATHEEKDKYLQEYKEKKRRRREGKSVGAIHGTSAVQENSSLFFAGFCNGAVEATVLADQGSDVNVMPSTLFEALTKADSAIKANKLAKARTFDTARAGLPPIACSRMVQADVELRIRHGEKLILRKTKWLVSDNGMAHAYIGRHVLAALGIDNRVMLAAARDRLGGIVDVPDVLKAAGHEDDPCADGATSIGSILRDHGFEWGSTFHSSRGAEDDKLDESDVYIDLGDDPPSALDEALSAMLERARSNGLSSAGTARLAEMLKRFRSVFEFGWEKPLQPTLPQ